MSADSCGCSSSRLCVNRLVHANGLDPFCHFHFVVVPRENFSNMGTRRCGAKLKTGCPILGVLCQLLLNNFSSAAPQRVCIIYELKGLQVVVGHGGVKIVTAFKF